MPSEAPIKLSPAQARILGALIEKEVTTPEYYPLSMNALLNACNQRSNREPVMALDEDDARQALHGLEDLRLAGRARSSDGRVTKYEHWLGEAFNLNRAETALLCVLLLRGPQTPGELRGRTERMHQFEEIADVLAGLQKLAEREPPLAAVLPRQPGTKEARYAQLLSGPVESLLAAPALFRATPSDSAAPSVLTSEFAPAPIAGDAPGQEGRIAQLEAAVAELRQEMAELKRKFDDLFA